MITTLLRRTTFLVLMLVTQSKAQESSNSSSVNYHVSAHLNATGHRLMNTYVTRDVVRESRPYIDFDVQLNEGFTPTQRMTVTATLAWNSPFASVLALPEGYEHFPGQGYYKFHTKSEIWNAARISCLAEGAHLIVINSVREAAVVKSFFDRSATLECYQSDGWYYVGVHDKTGKGEYVTVLGESFGSSGYTEGFSNWTPGYCGIINKDLKYAYGSCRSPRGYICEAQY